MAKRAVIKSFAKVNLYLDVICKRPDGYHNIETIFQTVSLADVIEMELASSGVKLSCDNSFVPTDESNLAFRAFDGFRKAVGYKGGVGIRLRKRIPLAAGLGGGSSNAAAVIVGLNRLLRGSLSEDQMRAIAADMGADVPFFISGGLAAAWRIGDKIELLPPLAKSYLVIAMPRNVSVSTADAYRMVSAPECVRPAARSLSRCSERLQTCVNVLATSKSLAGNTAIRSILQNSLEDPVLSRHPEIARLKDSLIKAGANGALMSGSGSAVFGLADSLSHAREIKRLVERVEECDCFVVQTVESGSEWRY